jgi:hypothetical protein
MLPATEPVFDNVKDNKNNDEDEDGFGFGMDARPDLARLSGFRPDFSNPHQCAWVSSHI